MLPMLLATASLAQAGEGLVGTGSGMVAGATLGHAVMWSLNDDRQSGMWVHYIPIAGPLVGMNEGGPMLTLADGFFLGMQVGGIALMTVGVASWQRDHLQLHVTPQSATLSLTW